MKRKGSRKPASRCRKLLLGAEEDLIRNDSGIAEAAGLDGDELGYLRLLAWCRGEIEED